MKAIRLKQISRDKKYYVVNLGNRTSNSFSVKREAESFLFSTNNFLTDKLHDLHQSYVDVWNCYQDNWFYFDNNRTTPKFSLYEKERACLSNLDAVKNLLQLSVDRAEFTNGNFFTFINLFKVADYLEDSIRIIAEMYSKHSNTNSIYKMDNILRRVMYARNEMQNYGKRSTTKLFKVPTHISEVKGYTPDFVDIPLRAA